MDGASYAGTSFAGSVSRPGSTPSTPSNRPLQRPASFLGSASALAVQTPRSGRGMRSPRRTWRRKRVPPSWFHLDRRTVAAMRTTTRTDAARVVCMLARDESALARLTAAGAMTGLISVTKDQSEGGADPMVRRACYRALCNLSTFVAPATPAVGLGAGSSAHGDSDDEDVAAGTVAALIAGIESESALRSLGTGDSPAQQECVACGLCRRGVCCGSFVALSHLLPSLQPHIVQRRHRRDPWCRGSCGPGRTGYCRTGGRRCCGASSTDSVVHCQ